MDEQTRPRIRWKLRCCLGLLCAGCAKADVAPPAIALKPADVTLPAEFSYVGSVRELSDGRLIIADQKESRLVVADSALGGITDISRIGDGPGEYRSLATVWAIGHDTTLLAERNRHRWLLFDGTRTIATLPPNHPAVSAFPYGQVVGSDSTARIIGRGYPQINRSGSYPDSLLLVRTTLSGDRIDTLAKLNSGKNEGGGSDHWR